MGRNLVMMKYILVLQKEALTILFHNPKFIILTFLTSLPLFFCMLFHELLFQKTLIKAAGLTSQKPEINLEKLERFEEEFSQAFLLLGFLYLAIVHLPDLISTIVTVRAASIIYSGEMLPDLRETLYRCFESGTFKRSLITSMYALMMTALGFLGLLALSSHLYIISIPYQSYFSFGAQFGMFTWCTLMYGVLIFALLSKYMEWSGLWNLGMVTSILEDKHGDAALWTSAYISRGNRQHGQILVAIFFVWKITLRLITTVYVGVYNNGNRKTAIIVTAIQVFLVCLGNVVKWLIFMIFFLDCKKEVPEKKVDVEEGKGDATPSDEDI